MSTPIQSITLGVVGATTDYSELNSISVLNLSADTLNIIDIVNGGLIKLNEGQSVTITSSTGFVLPDLTLDSAGVITASVITT